MQTSSLQTFTIDPAHSSVEFVVRHMMIAKVRGRFTAVKGTIEIPLGSHVPSAVEATIGTASVSTGEPQRDAHLMSPDFLDAATYPELTFRSNEIVAGGDAFELRGNLTIHGTTRPVTLHTTFEGEGTDPWGNRRYAYDAHAQINRKDFGLGWNQTLEAGGVLVGEEVKIELTIEAIAPR